MSAERVIKKVNKVDLALQNLADLNESLVNYDNNSPDEENFDHIIIGIPGIRTDGSWIYAIERGQKKYKILKASSGYVNEYALLLGVNRWKIKYEILTTIQRIVAENRDKKISVIAHSMGASIFADIINDIGEKSFAFEKIFFIGSVCHVENGRKISEKCARFFNDRGTKDRWPLYAQTFRPDLYSYTGIYGFNNNVDVVDRMFQNDHFSCTSVNHIGKNIIPILDGINIEIDAVEFPKSMARRHIVMVALRVFVFTPYPIFFPTLFIWISLIGWVVYSLYNWISHW